MLVTLNNKNYRFFLFVSIKKDIFVLIMIQRAQSIYLLSVTILMVFLAVLPIAEIAIRGGEIVIYYNFGIKSYVAENTGIIFHTLPITILTCVIGVISFVNIFLYYNRHLQMRLCLYNILLIVGLMVLIYFYFSVMRKKLNITDHTFKITIVFPVISAILTLLSLRSIRKDDVIVRSYERLR